ncbi:hypothetical protein FIBSPDRAFT_935590 [Athelia psychrophila]|uniref:Uncharacterized protein n=1 Tax=Athelia psychrophila TaxID=1759441 RepID=A0A166DKK7_9AGAM|nr:hypothetical protein FIBSPDRAFT_935590 [Fibularhizoctonia sp. CBS 109695]
MENHIPAVAQTPLRVPPLTLPPLSTATKPSTASGASGLEPLPEDDELVATEPGVKARPGIAPYGSRKTASNRNASIYGFPDGQEEVFPEEKYNNRLSWMTTTSIAKTSDPASYLDEIGLSDLSLPTSPSSSAFARASMASFATFMTENSADAITMSPGGDHRRFVAADSRCTTRADAEEEEGARSDGEGDLLDVYFTDAFGRPLSAVFDKDPDIGIFLKIAQVYALARACIPCPCMNVADGWVGEWATSEGVGSEAAMVLSIPRSALLKL